LVISLEDLNHLEEPAKAIQTDPKTLGLGMAKGTGKLIGKTIFSSVFGTTSKITGTVSSFAAQATLDDEYLKQRNIKSSNQPKHAGEGLAKGLRSFGTGLFEGVTDVVRQPIKGAEKGGALGFAQGVGKGLLGLAVKPVVGTVDLITQGAQGIANTTSYFENKNRDRKRLPRFFDERKIVLPYDPLKAQGQRLLYKLPDDRVQNEVYYFHTQIKGDSSNAVALLSNHTFYHFFKPTINIKGGYEIKHAFDLSYITSIHFHDNILAVEIVNSKLQLSKLNIKGINDELKHLYNTLIELQKSITTGVVSYEPPQQQPTESVIREHKANRGLQSPLRLLKEGHLQVGGKEKTSLCTVKEEQLSIIDGKNKPITIPLKQSLVMTILNNPKNLFLVLSKKGDIIELAAPSLRERQAWIDALLLNGAELKKLNNT